MVVAVLTMFMGLMTTHRTSQPTLKMMGPFAAQVDRKTCHGEQLRGALPKNFIHAGATCTSKVGLKVPPIPPSSLPHIDL